jgi:hypothetical protein
MTKQERELQEVQKYVDAMKGIAALSKDGKYVNFKTIQQDFKIQGIAIQGMCKYGYLKKHAYGKYFWNTESEITPFMARKVINFVREYFQEKHLNAPSNKDFWDHCLFIRN